MIDTIRKQLIDSFSKLSFEEQKHTYELDGKPLTAVSNCLKEFKNPFDFNKMATLYAKKHNRSVKDVKNEWDTKRINACNLGTKTHNFAENYFFNKLLKPSSRFEEAVVKFWSELPDYIVPVLPEVRIFSARYGFAGTIDNVFWNTRKNSIVLTDYKTNENLYKNFKGQKLKEPFEFLLDMPFSHYELQLSHYRIPIEDLGIPVDENQYVIWLLPDGNYKRIKTQNYSNHIRYHYSLKTMDL